MQFPLYQNTVCLAFCGGFLDQAPLKKNSTWYPLCWRIGVPVHIFVNNASDRVVLMYACLHCYMCCVHGR